MGCRRQVEMFLLLAAILCAAGVFATYHNQIGLYVSVSTFVFISIVYTRGIGEK